MRISKRPRQREHRDLCWPRDGLWLDDDVSYLEALQRWRIGTYLDGVDVMAPAWHLRCSRRADARGRIPVV